MGNNTGVKCIHQEWKSSEPNQADGSFETDHAYLPNTLSISPKKLSLESGSRKSLPQNVFYPKENGSVMQEGWFLNDDFEAITSTNMIEGVTKTGSANNKPLEISDHTKESNDLQYMEYIKLRGGHYKPHNKRGQISEDHEVKRQTNTEFILGNIPVHMMNDLEPFELFDENQSTDIFSLVENESCRKSPTFSYDGNERRSLSNFTVLSELSGWDRPDRNVSLSYSEARRVSYSRSASWQQEASSDESVEDIRCLTCGPYTNTGFEKALAEPSQGKEPGESIEFTPKFFSGANMLEVSANNSASQKVLRDRVKRNPRAPLWKKVIKTD